ncbi:MAG: iron-containing redox enzyme family protein [Nitrososphaerales archaeon]
MSLIERINVEIEKHSLLKHPFYQMWSKGELNAEHLRGYSKEYFQLVKQVPILVENTLDQTNDADKSLVETSLEEEKEHIELWKRFCASLGVPERELQFYTGQAEKSIEELLRLTSSSFEEAIAALYAYELELPKISRSKIDGLKKFYNLDSKDALVYFETHELVDVKHAAIWRKMLEQIKDQKKQELAYKAALKSLEAQNKLLDYVMERYVN